MAIITSTITYYRSTSYSFEATIIPPSGLTVTEGLFTIKSSPYDDDVTDDTAIFKQDVAAVDDVCSFSLTPTSIPDTVNPTNLYYSIHVVLSDGKIYPFAAGKFKLKATTTNRET